MAGSSLTLLRVLHDAFGLAAGIVGLIAIMQQHERSWLGWFAILLGLLALVPRLGGILMPH
jgi:hypothetical protein